MSNKSRTFLYLALVLILHLGLFWYKNYFAVGVDPGSIQQEEFLTYVDSLGSADFPDNLTLWNKRYFPGLPIAIYLIDIFLNNTVAAGLVVAAVALLVFYSLVYKITHNRTFSLTLTIFPPIVYELTSKISTEAMLIPIIILSYYLALKVKNYRFSALVSGVGVWIRPIAFISYLSLVVHILINEKEKVKRILTTYPFFLMVGLLGLFNYLFFNGNILHQLSVYETTTQLTSSLSGLAMDVKIEIGQNHWRILASSLSYIVFSLILLVSALKKRGDFMYRDDSAYIKSWSAMTMIFIFAYGPSQFLGDTRRFLSVFFPLVLLANYKTLRSSKLYYLAAFVLSSAAFV
ncbi:MAG: hypothetical protein PVJ52_03285 [Candidatus Woesebacteria bacterium]|jgi:hypothetical protein